MKIIKLAIFSIALILSSCATNDTSDIITCREDNAFIRDLKAFNAKQRATFKQLASRAGDIIPDDDLGDMGHKLDSNTKEFFLEHDEYLSQYAPEHKLTEDEFEMLLVDEDAMTTYLCEVVSPDVYDYVADFLDGNMDVNIDELANNSNLNPLEMAEIVSLAAYSDFRSHIVNQIHNVDEEDGVINNDDINNNDPLSRQQELANCETDFMVDFRDCGVLAIGSVFAYMYSGQGALVMGSFTYGVCLYTSYKSFKRCQRNVHMKYT